MYDRTYARAKAIQARENLDALITNLSSKEDVEERDPAGDEERRVDVLPIPIPKFRRPDAIIRPDGTWRNVRTQEEHEAENEHPLRRAVRALHIPDVYTTDRPLVIHAEPGYYPIGPVMLGGGWHIEGPNAVNTLHGEALHIALEHSGNDRGRAKLRSLSIMDKYNDVGTFRCSGIDWKNMSGVAAPIKMVCGDYSVGHLSFDDVHLYPADDGSYGGAGAKWGAHWGHGAASLLCRKVLTPKWSPEEHDHYVKGKRGPVQIRRFRSDAGNRTWAQFTGYADDPTPEGPILVEDGIIEDHGQGWSSYNGGSAVTLWWCPWFPEVVRRVKIRDSKYGAFSLTCQPGANVDHLWKGLWHHRYVVLDDCEFDNRSDDPGEVDGDRNAASLMGADTIEFRGMTTITGNLSLGSQWAAQHVTNANLVRRYLFEQGADIRLQGALLRWNPLTARTETVAVARPNEPLTLRDLKPHFEEAEQLAAKTYRN